MSISFLATLALAAALDGGDRVRGATSDCGSAERRPRRITHFAQKAVLTKVSPEYPEELRGAGTDAEVMVRILVSRQGLVERTCPAQAPGKAQPDVRLVVAAEAAARRWTFRPNFGFDEGAKPRFDYVEDVLVLRFVPRQRPADRRPQ
jgi:outer membrane biosynthesis protein TonB